MSRESRLMAGVVLVTVPSVIFGGASLLRFLIDPSSGYQANPLRQDLWRAGHAHAGVFLVLSLVILRYVDEARLSEGLRWLVRLSAPTAAILLPLAFFLSVLSPDARAPGGLVHLAWLGGLLLAAGTLTLGVGLIRAARSGS
jgi:hypothetical protein